MALLQVADKFPLCSLHYSMIGDDLASCAIAKKHTSAFLGLLDAGCCSWTHRTTDQDPATTTCMHHLTRTLSTYVGTFLHISLCRHLATAVMLTDGLERQLKPSWSRCSLSSCPPTLGQALAILIAQPQPLSNPALGSPASFM